jgi:hypothetical protein
MWDKVLRRNRDEATRAADGVEKAGKWGLGLELSDAAVRLRLNHNDNQPYVSVN